MSVYIHQRDFQLNDVDQTSRERHFVPIEKMNILDRNYIHKIQERFHELGFGYMVGNINGCFNVKLYGTIMAFQQQASLPLRRRKDFVNGHCFLDEVQISFSGCINGIFDSETAIEIDLWLRKGYINSCEKLLVQVGKTWIREDIATAIYRIKEFLLSKEGLFPDFLFACFRHPAGFLEIPGRKKKSLHCTGLAIDLDEWRGSQSQEDDFFFIERTCDESWVVYVQSRSFEISEVNILAWYFDWKSCCFYTKEVKERLINLSLLMDKEGLKPISALSGWEDVYYLSEWWHFQVNQCRDWFIEMQTIGFSREYLEFLGYV